MVNPAAPGTAFRILGSPLLRIADDDGLDGSDQMRERRDDCEQLVDNDRLCGLIFVLFRFSCMAAMTRGDTIIMKNGMVYLSQGAPDRDDTLVYIWDGLKKTVIRDSKIERITATTPTGPARSSNSFSRWWCTPARCPRKSSACRPARGTTSGRRRSATLARG